MVARTIHAHWNLDGIDLLVPVPLTGRRMRRRGFNQAWQLMKPFYRGKADRTVLRRVRRTAPQTGLTRRERRQNLAGAFAVRDPAAVVGRRVMVVDDVMTTGATLNACAEALLTAGAVRVDAVTLARTIQEAA
jgi:ComF family protein